jgi:hypothetical protein
MVAALAAGATFAEIANERGMPVNTVNKRLHRFVLDVRSIVATAAVGFALLLLVGRRFFGPGEGPVSTAPDWPLPTDPLLPLPERMDGEAAYEIALLRCADREHYTYRECFIWLNQARRLDPGREKDPAIVAARAAAERELEEHGGK